MEDIANDTNNNSNSPNERYNNNIECGEFFHGEDASFPGGMFHECHIKPLMRSGSLSRAVQWN